MDSTNVPRHLRRATAAAMITMPGEARAVLEERDALSTARVAATLSVKRAAELLPNAAEAEITRVDVDYHWEDDGLEVTVATAGVSREGIGPRALLGATTCATELADELGRMAGDISIEKARIVDSSGGCSDLEYDFDPPVCAAILVVSDAVAGGHKDDRAGERVRTAVEEVSEQGVELVAYEVVGDDRGSVSDRLSTWSGEGVDLVLTVGGTGLAHTDVTIEAVEPLLDRPVPGLMEAVRDYGYEQTPLAWVSRGVCGLIGDTMVVTLPGSTGGATEASQVLFPAVLHVFRVLRKSREHLIGDEE